MSAAASPTRTLRMLLFFLSREDDEEEVVVEVVGRGADVDVDVGWRTASTTGNFKGKGVTAGIDDDVDDDKLAVVEAVVVLSLLLVLVVVDAVADKEAADKVGFEEVSVFEIEWCRFLYVSFSSTSSHDLPDGLIERGCCAIIVARGC